MTKNNHLGSSVDDLLREEGTLEAAELAAIKMVIADQLAKEMKKKKLSQPQMIKHIGISKTTFMRLLNPKDYSTTLLTLYRITKAIGKALEIRFN